MERKQRACGRDREDCPTGIRPTLAGGSVEAPMGPLHQSGSRHRAIRATEAVQRSQCAGGGDLEYRAATARGESNATIISGGPVKVSVGTLNKGSARVSTVRASAEVVQSRQATFGSHFKNRAAGSVVNASAATSALRGGSVEVAIDALHQPAGRVSPASDVECVKCGQSLPASDRKDRATRKAAAASAILEAPATLQLCHRSSRRCLVPRPMGLH